MMDEQKVLKVGGVINDCDPSTWEVESEGSVLQGNLWLCRKL